MSEGQRMHSSGSKRAEFYDTVVSEAKVRRTCVFLSILNNSWALFCLKKHKDNPSDNDLLQAFTELQERVNGESFGKAGCSSREEPALPDVYIMFDEAHPLTDPFNPNQKGSHFFELRRALRVFSGESLFTFFLSTTGKISQFNPPRDRDPSNRMNHGELETPRPFIYLGFDQLMVNRKIFDKFKTLDEVTSLDCIAHMGRPL